MLPPKKTSRIILSVAPIPLSRKRTIGIYLPLSRADAFEMFMNILFAIIRESIYYPHADLANLTKHTSLSLVCTIRLPTLGGTTTSAGEATRLLRDSRDLREANYMRISTIRKIFGDNIAVYPP